MPTKRNRISYFLLLLVVIALGLSSRRFSNILPDWVTLYVGDALWAMMVYVGLGFLFQRKSPTWILTAALAFSYIIEMSQLYHAPWIDSIRRTTIGALILGFGFLWSDLLAYTIGAGIGWVLERLILLRRLESDY